MDDDSPPETQFRSESTTVNHGSAPYGGAFFPRSRDFTVSGTFTSVTNNYNEPAVPLDFRRIPFGDINMKHEIQLRGRSGIVDHNRVWSSVRRMYSARIFSDNSDMTVAVYQGDGAEEEWRDTISKYSSLRHPNFTQIFAIASSSGIYAIVAHDDLIPFNDFLKLYRESPILTVYIHGCCDRDKDEADDYFKHIFGDYLDDNITTFWIRRSTGQLCIDLTPGDVAAPYFSLFPKLTLPSEHIPPFHAPNSESIVIDSLELGEYHDVCYWDLGHWETFPVSTQAELHLGSVVYSPLGSGLERLVEIAFLPDANPHIGSWYGSRVNGHTMEDGWTRYNSAEIFGTTISSLIRLEYDDRMPWLSQANYIFHRLQIKSNYKDYAIIQSIDFQLRIWEPTQTPPKGYLFVCPIGDLRNGPTSFGWPGCPAYWSLDPSGAERLSTDEAMHLGFPSINLETEVKTESYDASVYAGLRKFHEGKRFDPDSQDVARHLGHPLYQLSREVEVPFAHVDGEVSDVETEREGCSTTTTEDEDEDEDGLTSADSASDAEVSDVEAEREGSSTANTEDEVETGSASEDVDAEIAELHAESEGTSPDTNEDEDCDELTPQEEYTSLDWATETESTPQSWSWKVLMFVKLGLILALGFSSLCEYGWAVLSWRDI